MMITSSKSASNLTTFDGFNLTENPNLTVDELGSSSINPSDSLNRKQETNTLFSAIAGTDSNSEQLKSLDRTPIFKENEETIAIHPLGEVVVEAVTTQPTYTGTSLINLNAFRADSRFAGIDGHGLSVVILDTGIDLNHPFFGADSDNNGIADRIVYQYDFADNDTDASDRTFGHGSHVSSVIASQDSQFMGVAPKVNIIQLKVFKDSGSGTFTDIERALQWVINNTNTYNIVGVNMSLGDNGNYNTPQQRYGIADEMATLANNKVAVVSAAGNDFYRFNSVQGVSYPAADPNGLAVGSVYASSYGEDSYSSGAIAYTADADRIAPYSQRDTALTTIFAPGAIIGGANATGGVVYMSGTSTATPFVTGAIALAQQLAVEKLGRRLSVPELSSLLKSTGTTINDGDNEDDNVTNTGANFKRLDMYGLGSAIVNLANPTPVTPKVSIGAATISQNEGDSGTVAYTFTVSLDRTPSQPATVNYQTNDGTATVAGNDYIDNDGTLTFNPGSSLTQNVTVYSKGDTLVETNENFTVKLTAATNATLNSQAAQATGTIVNDDSAPVISMMSVKITQQEGNSGTTDYDFLVGLNKTSNQVITVKYYADDYTATVADGDYINNDGLLTFNPGELMKSITVKVNGDTKVEADEKFIFKLTRPINATVSPTQNLGWGVITNDDLTSASAKLFQPEPFAGFASDAGLG